MGAGNRISPGKECDLPAATEMYTEGGMMCTTRLFKRIQTRVSSHHEVVELYRHLSIDWSSRSGAAPENVETLPDLIRRIPRWEYCSALPEHFFDQCIYWFRENLPEDHLSNLITNRGKNRKILDVARVFVRLVSDPAMQAAHSACYLRKQTQAYIQRVLAFCSIYQGGELVAPLIAIRGKLPTSPIYLIDGNTRLLAAACHYIETQRMPELSAYLGRKPLF